MSQMRALIFDQDGVIADTERDGHRVAFNRVFEEEGLGVSWSVQRYGELLKIAGGKERMKTVVYGDDFHKHVADKEAYIRKLHKRKTDVFTEIVARELYDHRQNHDENENILSDPQHAARVKKLASQMQAGWKAARPG